MATAIRTESQAVDFTPGKVSMNLPYYVLQCNAKTCALVYSSLTRY